MSPTGSETEQCNFDLIVQLGVWTKQDGTGLGFDHLLSGEDVLAGFGLNLGTIW